MPTSTERMQLYRELDNLEREVDVEAFRRRLMDRFGFTDGLSVMDLLFNEGPESLGYIQNVKI